MSWVAAEATGFRLYGGLPGAAPAAARQTAQPVAERTGLPVSTGEFLLDREAELMRPE
jgi:hypothetical protein